MIMKRLRLYFFLHGGTLVLAEPVTINGPIESVIVYRRQAR
jgi:hypothetical protein